MVADHWRTRAACAGTATDQHDPFFAVHTDRDEQAALAVCGSCPVTSECLGFAVRNRQEHGIWGGRPQREVRRLIAEDRARQRVSREPTHPNATKTHCPQGHAYDEANTYRSSAGRRLCRACIRDSWRRRSRAHQLQNQERRRSQ